MFDELEPQNTSSKEANKEQNKQEKSPEDIFAEVDSKNRDQMQQVEEDVENMTPEQMMGLENPKKSGPHSLLKLLLIGGGIILFTGAAAAGAYYWMSYSEGDYPAEIVAETNEETLETEDQQQDESNSAQETTPENFDTDGDGLADTFELERGSNPSVTDTDNDGLSDYQEVIVYQTNPINPDSDGDSYNDGEEVGNGYNPLGSGLLE